MQKTSNFVSESHFWEVRVTHDLGRWLVKKAMFDFLFALIELFSLSIIRFRSYEAKCVQLAGFHRGRVLHLIFTRRGSINHCWHQKTRDTGLPNGAGRIRLHSLVSTQHRTVTDGWTNGRICRSIYSASRSTVKTSVLSK